MNVNPFETRPDSTFRSPESFEVVLQHWAKAMIDTPLQLVARFDDAAKQLIAIGGTLQGLLIAVSVSGFFVKDHLFPRGHFCLQPFSFLK